MSATRRPSRGKGSNVVPFPGAATQSRSAKFRAVTGYASTGDDELDRALAIVRQAIFGERVMPKPETERERLVRIVDKVTAKWNDPTFRAGVRHCQDCPKGRV